MDENIESKEKNKEDFFKKAILHQRLYGNCVMVIEDKESVLRIINNEEMFVNENIEKDEENKRDILIKKAILCQIIYGPSVITFPYDL